MQDFGGETYHCLDGCSPQGGFAVGAELIGVSTQFHQVLKLVDAVAANDCVVLLEGESGTGKELLARRIHMLSKRAAGPFIPVNCPAVSESLFESQFYGHVRGSFTGAASDTLGIVRAAEGGTLLLDEIGELTLHLQPKLLRLLQHREVTPVGAAKPIPVNVRFVAATNCNLVKQVSKGAFRSDLYHRLNIVRIEMPPLRNRPDDITALIDYYLEFYAVQYGMPRCEISPYMRSCLLKYNWPGNIRELCAYIERLYAANLPPMSPYSELIDGEYVPSPDAAEPQTVIPPLQDRFASDNINLSVNRQHLNLAKAEAEIIRKALELTRYNRSAAARLLQIHRTTLQRKIRLLGLD